MEDNKMLSYVKDVLDNMPTGWFDLTTHRLDIYNEKLAKTQFKISLKHCLMTIILIHQHLVNYLLHMTISD